MKKLLPILILLLVVSCSKQDSMSPNPVNPGGDTTEVPGPNGLIANKYSGLYVRNYFTLLCKLSKSTAGFFPPQVARAYGYVGITNYEVVVNGIPGAKSLAGQINGLTATMLPKVQANVEYNWSIASNAAIAEMIRRMFELKMSAADEASVDSTEAANLAALSQSNDQQTIDRSVEYGKQVAAAIYEYSKGDNGFQSYIDPFQLPYSMPPEPFCWLPTGPVKNPISPKWGDNRPFITENVANALRLTPIPYSTDSTSAFYKEAMKVYTQVKNNTPEQVTIAKYWSDDPFNTCTPAGHTFNIMTQLLEENNATLEKTSVAYAKLCIAENDAFIACWKGKYNYILLRPVTYIQKNIDSTFNTVIGTPAFPTYNSGHSCEIGAGSKVFINEFTKGDGKYRFTDYSQLQYGFEARTYSDFDEMAVECANSRFYGGIHYPMDNTDGLIVGREIGDNVNKMINWPKNTK